MLIQSDKNSSSGMGGKFFASVYSGFNLYNPYEHVYIIKTFKEQNKFKKKEI